MANGVQVVLCGIDNSCSDVILVAVDLPSKVAWIWMKQWQICRFGLDDIVY